MLLVQNISQHLSGTARTIGAALVGRFGTHAHLWEATPPCHLWEATPPLSPLGGHTPLSPLGSHTLCHLWEAPPPFPPQGPHPPCRWLSGLTGRLLSFHLGVRTFSPRSASNGFLYMGGPPVVLSLIAMAPDDSSLYAAVKVLVSVLETNVVMQQEMTRINGYQVWAGHIVISTGGVLQQEALTPSCLM